MLYKFLQPNGFILLYYLKVKKNRRISFIISDLINTKKIRGWFR